MNSEKLLRRVHQSRQHQRAGLTDAPGCPENQKPESAESSLPEGALGCTQPHLEGD